MKKLFMLLLAFNTIAAGQKVHYFQCTETETGNEYYVTRSSDDYVDYDSFDLTAINDGYYGYNLVHLDTGKYYKTYEKENDRIFEVYEKEYQGSIGLGPDGMTLPATASEISKFTINKVTGSAKLVRKSTYMFITVSKETTHFENCFNVR